MEQLEQPDYALPRIRSIAPGAVWSWLRAGWSDLKRVPLPSLFYGVVLAAMGYLLTRFIGQGAYALALITGFLLVGPFLAMGLYDISRTLERGEPVRLSATLLAWRANVPAIGLYTIIVVLLMAVWIRISVVVVALFFEGGMPSATTLWSDIVQSEHGLVFLLVYAAAGFGFALLVFATSVVSLPMLLDRSHMDTISAMITSFNAVRLNLFPMLLWAAIVVALTAVGFVTYYIGLVVAIPVIGHATWHAYRDVVDRQTAGEQL
jgi:uncharacterized membrane protein